MVYHFNMDNFLKNVPSENAGYMHMLRETQGVLSNSSIPISAC